MNEDIGMRSLVVKVLDLQAEGTEFDSHQQYEVRTFQIRHVLV